MAGRGTRARCSGQRAAATGYMAKCDVFLLFCGTRTELFLASNEHTFSPTQMIHVCERVRKRSGDNIGHRCTGLGEDRDIKTGGDIGKDEGNMIRERLRE